MLLSKTHSFHEIFLTSNFFQIDFCIFFIQMPIYFRIRYPNGIVTYGYIGIILSLASIQFICLLMFSTAQKAVFTLRIANITMKPTDSYKTIPFQDCLCSVISISLCIPDRLLQNSHVLSLLLFTLLVYFFWIGLTRSGNGAHIFVYLYWTFCFVCFFTISTIIHWKNYYYNEMSIVLIVMSLSELFIYLASTLPNDPY